MTIASHDLLPEAELLSVAAACAHIGDREFYQTVSAVYRILAGLTVRQRRIWLSGNAADSAAA